MVDVVKASVRSRMMASIKGKDTRPELIVRRFLHAQGFRYRLHAPDLPGRPDMKLTKYAVVIQVHGCFWHRHSRCKYSTSPASHVEMWQTRFADNVKRDKRTNKLLNAADWRVIVIWECGLKSADSVQKTLSWLPSAIRRGRESILEWPRLASSRKR